MTLFVDRMALHLADPVNVLDVIAPASDPSKTRARALVSAMYDFPFATIHDIVDVQVLGVERGRPLFAPRRIHGTWMRTQPTYTRTDVDEDQVDLADPLWLDLAVAVGLTLVVELDPGEVESVLLSAITDFNTLNEFRAHFQFIDLDAFMTEQGITDVAELRERFHYLLAEVRLRALQPFNAADPANRHHYNLNLALLIRDSIDVVGGLRDAKLARSVIERTFATHAETADGEIRTPYAPVVVFPQTALAGAPYTAAQVEAFFGAEGVMALFLAPP